jgi:hypothetical protein
MELPDHHNGFILRKSIYPSSPGSFQYLWKHADGQLDYLHTRVSMLLMESRPDAREWQGLWVKCSITVSHILVTGIAISSRHSGCDAMNTTVNIFSPNTKDSSNAHDHHS